MTHLRRGRTIRLDRRITTEAEPFYQRIRTRMPNRQRQRRAASGQGSAAPVTSVHRGHPISRDRAIGRGNQEKTAMTVIRRMAAIVAAAVAALVLSVSAASAQTQ